MRACYLVFSLVFALESYLPVISAAQVASWSTLPSDGFSPRENFSATYVEGKIYAIGGYNLDSSIHGNRYLSTLEVFDFSSTLWSTPKPSPPFSGRYAHTATMVGNNIYVIGGRREGPIKAIEVYDPLLNVWRTLSTSGNFHERFNHTASVVDGKIYIIGGQAYSNDTVVEINIFDPKSNAWETPVTQGVFTPRSELSASAINGKIYTIGGATYDRPAKMFSELEVFDVATNTWMTLPTTGTFIPRYRHVSEVIDEKIYVIGGSTDTVNVFDPATNHWSIVETKGTFTKRSSLASVLVDSKVYTMGGYTFGGQTNAFEVFSPTQSAVISNKFDLSELIIFPNPAVGFVNVTVLPEEACKLEVLNVLGGKVAELDFNQLSYVQMDLSNLPAGLYYIRCSGSKSTITAKLILQ